MRGTPHTAKSGAAYLGVTRSLGTPGPYCFAHETERVSIVWERYQEVRPRSFFERVSGRSSHERSNVCPPDFLDAARREIPEGSVEDVAVRRTRGHARAASTPLRPRRAWCRRAVRLGSWACCLR